MISLTKSIVLMLLVAESFSTTAEDGVKYANKCEGL